MKQHSEYCVCDRCRSERPAPKEHAVLRMHRARLQCLTRNTGKVGHGQNISR